MSAGRACLALALALSAAAGAYAASPLVITQINRAFSLREVRIKRGDVVRFSNADEFIHHVYVNAPNFKFASEEQEPGRQVEVRFPVPGNFEVRCEIHPRMLLQLSVE